MNINMLEAKTHLSKLIQRALDGAEIVLARNGEPTVPLGSCAKT
jgi:antitoxin (DNA-binding transcriptional repressor) of toxin-antitoxin stability system